MRLYCWVTDVLILNVSTKQVQRCSWITHADDILFLCTELHRSLRFSRQDSEILSVKITGSVLKILWKQCRYQFRSSMIKRFLWDRVRTRRAMTVAENCLNRLWLGHVSIDLKHAWRKCETFKTDTHHSAHARMHTNTQSSSKTERLPVSQTGRLPVVISRVIASAECTDDMQKELWVDYGYIFPVHFSAKQEH